MIYIVLLRMGLSICTTGNESPKKLLPPCGKNVKH